MKLAVLFSGGKDSCYAMYKAMQENEIACLISILSENKESYMFHTPNIHLVDLQAEAISIPLVKFTTKGEKELELKDLKDAIKQAKEKYQFEGIVTGAIASVYQTDRIQKICDELNLKCINPLWKKDQKELLFELIENNFKVMIIGIFAYPLDKTWLGKELDEDIINKLIDLRDKYKINPAGEGGEIETLVLDAPFFKKKIEITDSEIDAKGNAGIIIIKDAKLTEK